MSAATAGATAAMTACLAAVILAAVILDDERRRRAEGCDDTIDYSFDPTPDTFGRSEFIAATVLVFLPAAAILCAMWYFS